MAESLESFRSGVPTRDIPECNAWSAESPMCGNDECCKTKQKGKMSESEWREVIAKCKKYQLKPPKKRIRNKKRNKSETDTS